MPCPNVRVARAGSCGRPVLFWFIGTATLAVWYVFRDPRFDHRFLIVGVLTPDVIDGVWGGARAMHSLVGSVAILVGVMFATVGRRPLRRRLLAIPIGTFMHLVFDGAFSATQVFWWPFGGVSFEGARLPVVERGWVNVPLEAAGLILCAWAWRMFGLGEKERRTNFVRSGTLAPSASFGRSRAR